MADGCPLPSIWKSQCFSFFVLLLMVLGSCASKSGLPKLDTCIEVKTVYSEKGFDENDVPVKAISGSDLAICPRTETCCTKAMEEQLTSQSRKEHTAHLNKTFNLLQRTFLQRSRKFDEFFTELVNNAEQGLDDMFLETYGVLYRQNSQIFKDLFRDLRQYYKGKDSDLMGVMDKFFDKLLRKMFRLMNSLFEPDDKYMRCVSSSMKDLKPFDDVPTKLSLHVKRAFIAARTFVQGLAVGRDVIANIKEMAPSDSCVKAIVRMTYCPHCQGLTSTKPCSFYCLNTMKGCLANHAELNTDWNKYIDALNKLADRLDGPFNIESVVAPIDVDISNAIMNLQETGIQFTEKVSTRCGDVTKQRKAHTDSLRAKREAQGPSYQPQAPQHSQYHHHQTGQDATFSHQSSRQQHMFDMRRPSRPASSAGGRKSSKSRHSSWDCNKSGNCLLKMVRDLKDKLQPTKDFWTQLPYMACQEEHLATDGAVQNDCWNGTDRARYVPEVQKDGVLRQINNPEVEVEVQVVNSVFNRQRVQLQHITSKLNSAYRGEHVEWVDTGMDTYVSSSGSGDGMIYDDDDDDEDDDDDAVYDGDDEEDGYDYESREDDFSDDEDDMDGLMEGSGHGYQGSGSGGHGYVTDDERKGIVNIDMTPGKFTPTGSGGYSGQGRGHGRNRNRHHRKGGHDNYPRWDHKGGDHTDVGVDTYSNNRGNGGGNMPPKLNPGGGMYNPNINNNRNANKNNRGEGRGEEVPTAEEGGQGGKRNAASRGSAANAGVILLLFGAHWWMVRRFLPPSCLIHSCC